MNHSNEGPGLGEALRKFDCSDSNERFWHMFKNVKIRKEKFEDLKNLKLFRVVEENFKCIKVKKKLTSHIIST